MSAMDAETRELWRVMLGRFRDAPEGLAGAFDARWRANAFASAPAGLPSSVDVADVHGWAAALEMFLVGHNEPSEDTRLLATAIKSASAVYKGVLGDAWLADLLALRRLPSVDVIGAEASEWHDHAACVVDYILAQIGRISTVFPSPDYDAYAFFRRRYDALALALVAEVVEGIGADSVTFRYIAGSRLLPPDARTAFAEVALVRGRHGLPHKTYEASRAVADRWAVRIGELVDTLIALNEGIEVLGDSAPGWRSRGSVQLIEEHRQAWSRMFDRAFRMLLAGDRRQLVGISILRSAPLLRALDRLASAAGTAFFGSSRPSIDLTMIQSVLWDGYAGEPEVVFDPAGVISVGGALGIRLRNEEQALFEAGEGILP